MQKEKEVKRQRKLLEQQMENGSTPSNSRALVSLETGKCLRLASQYIAQKCQVSTFYADLVGENTPPTSPVFHTQLDENCSNGMSTRTDIYSGTPPLWSPWGHSRVSCIERCPHFRNKFTL